MDQDGKCSNLTGQRESMVLVMRNPLLLLTMSWSYFHCMTIVRTSFKDIKGNTHEEAIKLFSPFFESFTLDFDISIKDNC